MANKHKLTCGVGYTGIGKYKPLISGKQTKAYKTWLSILFRCYNEKFRKKHPSYIDCKMSKDWHDFQIFAEWFNNNYIEGFELDKDILVKGNKIYSSETCCFVPAEINLVFIKNNVNRGKYAIGVRYRDKNKKFTSSINKNGKSIHIGTFYTEQEAFNSYCIEKHKHIQELAEKWKDKINENVYISMIKYRVEKTD